MPHDPPDFGHAERHAADRLIALALQEDLGAPGDLTTRALVGHDQTGAVRIVSRSAGILAGMPIVELVFRQCGANVEISCPAGDGTRLDRGTVVARLSGPLGALLTGERTALNFLTHLSGIATLTRKFVDGIRGTRAKVYDTRKTHPGWRLLEKYAVRAGGGCNHRTGLYDMVLIKDNHRAAWCAEQPNRTLAAAVRQARARSPAGTVVEIEVDALEQLPDALSGGPDIVLLDNMPPDSLRRAVEMRNALAPQIELEASGGVSLNSISAIAATGVERISVGQLTHSAPALDLGLDWELG